MATARDLSYKITSLTNMQKVMSAMNMIASTKLRKLLIRLPALDQFSHAVDSIGQVIAAGLSSSTSPFIHRPGKIEKTHIVAITADKGLCGSHNSSVLKALTKTIETANHGGTATDVTCIGARAGNLCRKRNYTICHAIDSNERHISDAALREITADIIRRIQLGEVNQIVLIYNHFVSTLVQQTRQVQIFPLQQASDTQTGQPGARKSGTVIETEPPAADFIPPAAYLYLYYQLKIALTDSYLSEHAARMTAMESAKTNSEDLINRYTTIRNRARQSAITSELIEIVAGKEALNN